MSRPDNRPNVMQGGDAAQEGSSRDVAESLISSRLQATHLDSEDRDNAALDAGLSEEAAASLRQRIDERLRQAADGARGFVGSSRMTLHL